jgi:inorganic pyrophosphatase
MSLDAYLESQPLREIVPRHKDSRAEACAFTGVPRKHPYDEGKLILFTEVLSESPRMVEFRLADVVLAEDLPSPVSESGEGIPLMRIWIRKGSLAVQYDPFEVADRPIFMRESPELRARFLKAMLRHKT